MATRTNKNIFTKEGLQKVKEELDRLKNEVRKEIAEKLAIAKEFGDLSENAAYTAAIEQRDMNEAKIAELEDTINNAVTVKTDSKNSDGKVSIGDHVYLEDPDGGKLDFQIVGTGETDIVKKKFSANSPLVEAIIGHKAGDKVEINLPTGKKTYKIVKVK